MDYKVADLTLADFGAVSAFNYETFATAIYTPRIAFAPSDIEPARAVTSRTA